MWGQDAEYEPLLRDEGIIPTRVGTSYHKYALRISGKDHPHACGDK